MLHHSVKKDVISCLKTEEREQIPGETMNP
jgi:hypothetical protein